MDAKTRDAIVHGLNAGRAHDLVPASIYDRPGPFCTVYLDASRVTESGVHEVELRWRAIREQLADAGAFDQELQALDAAIDADVSTGGRHGLVLVSCGDTVVLSAHLPQPPRREGGSRSPLPHLVPYLAQHSTFVPHLLVVADRTGADLLATGPTREALATVQGSAQHPVHKTGRDQWDERHFQNRVDGVWETNAEEVADTVAARIRAGAAQLVVLAGDQRARTLIRAALERGPAGTVAVTEVEDGGRAAGADDDALAEAVRQAVLSYVRVERRELLGHLQQNLGRDRYAAAGMPAVVEALRQAQVDTVVLSDDPSSTLRAAVGPLPTDLALTEQDLVATGVPSPQWERFDAALLRAVAGTGARLVVTPDAHDYVQDGIAALLRYDDRTAND